jgi:hypothetical protein
VTHEREIQARMRSRNGWRLSGNWLRESPTTSTHHGGPSYSIPRCWRARRGSVRTPRSGWASFTNRRSTPPI